jgi:hypothetical protein
MVYMAGENDLSTFAGLDLAEIQKAASSNEVKVPLMVERDPKLDPSAASNAHRGAVVNGQLQLTDLGSDLVFSDKKTLSDFIKWAKATYPAEHYGLVLWSHGSGWKSAPRTRGALYDDNGGRGYTNMSVQDMAAAVSDAGGVDLVNFDACSMGMYEVAYEFRNAANVLVASEDAIPGLGNPYDRVLNRLVAQPTQDAATLGKNIVEEFNTDYQIRSNLDAQLAAIDLKQMDAVHQAVQTTASMLMSSLSTARLGIENARNAAPYYNDAASKDLVQFADALTKQADVPAALKTQAAYLAQIAQHAVFANKTWTSPASASAGSRLRDSLGLSIYLPDPSQTNARERSDYNSILASNASANTASGSTNWGTFVDRLVTGSPQASPSPAASVEGRFGYYITWDNPNVDLDLFIHEPAGQWAGPALDAASPNGFSSLDSHLSGQQMESYTAGQTVDAGLYHLFVNFAGCENGLTSCGSTTVTLYRYDPRAGDTGYVAVGKRAMSATPALPSTLEPTAANPLPAAFVSAIDSNQYGDWVHFGSTTRGTAPSFTPSAKPMFDISPLSAAKHHD